VTRCREHVSHEAPAIRDRHQRQGWQLLQINLKDGKAMRIETVVNSPPGGFGQWPRETDREHPGTAP
jgi:hypothetical protein